MTRRRGLPPDRQHRYQRSVGLKSRPPTKPAGPRSISTPGLSYPWISASGLGHRHRLTTPACASGASKHAPPAVLNSRNRVGPNRRTSAARLHAHVQCPDGEAKFWLEPAIALAQNHGLSEQPLRAAKLLIEGHVGEIRSAWQEHFAG